MRQSPVRGVDVSKDEREEGQMIAAFGVPPPELADATAPDGEIVQDDEVLACALVGICRQLQLSHEEADHLLEVLCRSVPDLRLRFTIWRSRCKGRSPCGCARAKQ